MVFGNALLSPIFHLGALTSSLYLHLVLLSFSLQKKNDLYLTYQTDLLYEICDCFDTIVQRTSNKHTTFNKVS